MRMGNRSIGWIVCGLILIPPAVRAADEDAIQQAIKRGVESLRNQQGPNGAWKYLEAPTAGPTALAGLTLLECDVHANDPAVLKAAEIVRPESIKLTHTYSLALAILFLDRLGEPADVPLIQSMAVRLLAGQNASGGWGYDCPTNTKSEISRLTTLLRQRRELVGGRQLPKAAPANPRDRRPALPHEIQNLLNKVNPKARAGLWEDNSNTKFATLALWVARRHGMPVDKALALVETRFRTSQNGDGGWGYKREYRDRLSQSYGTMTCAGLLGLAFGHGSSREAILRTDPQAKNPRGAAVKPRDPAQDPSIRAGLLVLGGIIGQPIDNPGPIALFNPKGDEYYFLWALERVAVAYGLQTIGNKDWYAWGSDILLARQRGDGGWQGQYQGGPDTCFALLFLRRANLTRDLTATLKGSVLDPGKVTLRSGGVGGQGLEKKDPKPDNQPPAKPAEKPTEDPPEPPKAKVEPPPVKPAPPPPTEEAALEAEAVRLSGELVKAPPNQQAAMLGKMKDHKGVVYTQALAAAIPKLTGETRNKARDALAERLTRMTAGTLRDRLQDDNLEIRRAAALACAMKEDKSHISALIGLLGDPEPTVGKAAYVALKNLTGKDFGPKPGASRAERKAAMEAWKRWWESQKK